MRVAVVGHVEWIEFARVDARAARRARSCTRPSAWEEAGGGGAVAAVQLAQASPAACDFFTALGDDELGHRARARARRTAACGVHAAWRDEPQRRARHVRRRRTASARSRVIGAEAHAARRRPAALGRARRRDAVYFTGGDAGALREARRAQVLVATARELPTLARGRRPARRARRAARPTPASATSPATLDPPPRLVVATRGAHGGDGHAAAQHGTYARRSAARARRGRLRRRRLLRRRADLRARPRRRRRPRRSRSPPAAAPTRSPAAASVRRQPRPRLPTRLRPRSLRGRAPAGERLRGVGRLVADHAIGVRGLERRSGRSATGRPSRASGVAAHERLRGPDARRGDVRATARVDGGVAGRGQRLLRGDDGEPRRPRPSPARQPSEPRRPIVPAARRHAAASPSYRRCGVPPIASSRPSRRAARAMPRAEQYARSCADRRCCRVGDCGLKWGTRGEIRDPSMLLGEHEHTIDDKNRLTLPARFREAWGRASSSRAGSTSASTSTRATSGTAWSSRQLAALDPLSREAREMERYFYSAAVEADVDKQGRVMIPAPLLVVREARARRRRRRCPEPARDLGSRSLEKAA